MLFRRDGSSIYKQVKWVETKVILMQQKRQQMKYISSYYTLRPCENETFIEYKR